MDRMTTSASKSNTTITPTDTSGAVITGDLTENMKLGSAIRALFLFRKRYAWDTSLGTSLGANYVEPNSSSNS